MLASRCVVLFTFRFGTSEKKISRRVSRWAGAQWLHLGEVRDLKIELLTLPERSSHWTAAGSVDSGRREAPASSPSQNNHHTSMMVQTWRKDEPASRGNKRTEVNSDNIMKQPASPPAHLELHIQASTPASDREKVAERFLIWPDYVLLFTFLLLHRFKIFLLHIVFRRVWRHSHCVVIALTFVILIVGACQ